MEKFRDIIAHLIFDLNWKWLERIIEFLCDTEMALKRKLNPCLAECKLSENMEKIPEGFYCYSEHHVCPFYDRSNVADFFFGCQSSGYCHYMKKGDYTIDETFLLLWDMCKECELNYGEEYEDEE